MTTIKNGKAGPCDGRLWKNLREEMECRFPDPPIGRWKAVYTKEFAEQHNLPAENISSDLSPGVDYMEMDVQPYGKGNVGCFVNMLIKKPNDIAVYNARGKTGEWGPTYNTQRKLIHFLDLDAHKKELNGIDTFGLVPRNAKYDPEKSYSIGSSTGFYAENILDGYDYITVEAGCYSFLSDPSRFPDKWSFNYAKASIWGRNKMRYRNIDDPGHPQGKEFFDSRISIDIPSELISTIFKDMPVGGRK